MAKKYYRHGEIDVQLTYENEEVEMLIMDIDYLEEVSGDAEIPISTERIWYPSNRVLFILLNKHKKPNKKDRGSTNLL